MDCRVKPGNDGLNLAPNQLRGDDARRRNAQPVSLTWSQNALNVMMVRVSWMPGMVCTFSLTKWPMSVLSST
jgi:hypothetical protein